MTVTRSPWLLRRRARPGAARRLYCFPHSGGTAGEYVRWTDLLPEVELWALQPPGRGGRSAEPGHTSMRSLVEAIVDDVAFVPPYTLFGHSLGALVAYETALELRRRGMLGPERLILSACAAPDLFRPGPATHELDDHALMDAVEREYGPLPEGLRDDPELAARALAGLRADLAVVASYRPPAAEPLTCPITVIGGGDDSDRPEALTGWHTRTTGPFDLRIFPGDHFYFRERLDDFTRFLARTLAQRP